MQTCRHGNLSGKKGFFRFYSGLTKTSTALPRLSSKRTIL
ncbi:branched-chain amino acid permease [Neisseria meningitidis]|nr:branched-chain amino acid permease [Neisseria meningitidis]